MIAHMTLYGIDVDGRALIALRRDGFAITSATVAEIPSGVGESDARSLTGALCSTIVAVQEEIERPESRMDRSLAALERLSPEDSRRQLAAAVRHALEDPDPDKAALQDLYDPAERCAHRAGRVLTRIRDPVFTAAVVAHVACAIAGVIGPGPGRAGEEAAA